MKRNNWSKEYPIRKMTNEDFPERLLEIPDAPKEMWIRGKLPSSDTKLLCIVGSRKFSEYGEEACRKLIAGLSGYDIAIVSGLALGIDSIAHEAALDSGLITIAVPGSGLDERVLYPKSHQELAGRILNAGGCMLSEFPPTHPSFTWTFPQRNRIMAALSHAVLVIEAELKSGTLITSKFATDYNRDVLTIPGSIFSSTSDGPHMLIRLGATPITKSGDILEAFGMKPNETNSLGLTEIKKDKYKDCGEDEMTIINLLLKSPLPRDDLIRESGLPIQKANMALSILEIKELIVERLGELHVL